MLVLRHDAFDDLPPALLSEALLRGHVVFADADCAILVGSAVRVGPVLGGGHALQVDRVAFRRLRDRLAQLLASEREEGAPDGAPAASAWSNRRTTVYLGDGMLLSELQDGQPIYLDGSDISLTPHIARHGKWEAKITERVLADLAPGMHFVDIGANCGYYALLAARAVGETGAVTAIDANPRMAEMMRMSAAINGYDERMNADHVQRSESQPKARGAEAVDG